MLIDFHTHTQPDQATADEFFGWLDLETPPNRGTPDELFAHMDRLGIQRTLIVPWLPAQDLVARRVRAGEQRPDAVHAVIQQWRELNAWAAKTARENPQRISSLVGVDPVLMTTDEVEAEFRQRISDGACGLKIAPMFLDVPPDHPGVRCVWDCARALGVFILSESGAHGFERPSLGRHQAWGHPRGFESLLRDYPDVRVQLAHLGNGAEDEVARLTRSYPNVVTDLSLRLAALDTPGNWSSEQMLKTIRTIGTDRVLYGTNYPIVDVDEFAANFARLGLTDAEREQVAYRNAVALLSGS